MTEHKKGPRPYKGQNPRQDPDDFSVWHDLSNPKLEHPLHEPDTLPDADEQKPEIHGNLKKIRWFR